MLHEESFSPGWIEMQRKAMGCDPLLLEKAIVALQLVGHLVEAGLPFQFKGGTSLLLIVNPVRRLSIDVDIVTQAKKGELDAVLRQVEKLPPFRGIVHDEARDAKLPPKSHFRALYPSHFRPPDGHILLDVLFEERHAARPTLISTPFIRSVREVRALVPDANELLGDKLTAFAPKTIGILENPEQAMSIVKQLFDVAILFDHATDLPAAAAVYEAIHANQCSYRQAYTYDDTLDDTIAASLSLTRCRLSSAGDEGDPTGLLLQDGVARLQSHIANGRFTRDVARIAAGKAACAAAWIKRRPATVAIENLRFSKDRVEELKAAEIVGAWAPLQKLRGGNLEAFFYWWRTQKLLEGGQ